MGWRISIRRCVVGGVIALSMVVLGGCTTYETISGSSIDTMAVDSSIRTKEDAVAFLDKTYEFSAIDEQHAEWFYVGGTGQGDWETEGAYSVSVPWSAVNRVILQKHPIIDCFILEFQDGVKRQLPAQRPTHGFSSLPKRDTIAALSLLCENWTEGRVATASRRETEAQRRLDELRKSYEAGEIDEQTYRTEREKVLDTVGQ